MGGRHRTRERGLRVWGPGRLPGRSQAETQNSQTMSTGGVPLPPSAGVGGLGWKAALQQTPPHYWPHQFSLLMWSPKPGVSMTVSFIRTPFSSMSAETPAPNSGGPRVRAPQEPLPCASGRRHLVVHPRGLPQRLVGSSTVPGALLGEGCHGGS